MAFIAKQNLFVRRTFVYVILYVVDFLNLFILLLLIYQRVYKFWSSFNVVVLMMDCYLSACESSRKCKRRYSSNPTFHDSVLNLLQLIDWKTSLASQCLDSFFETSDNYLVVLQDIRERAWRKLREFHRCWRVRSFFQSRNWFWVNQRWQGIC